LQAHPCESDPGNRSFWPLFSWAVLRCCFSSRSFGATLLPSVRFRIHIPFSPTSPSIRSTTSLPLVTGFTVNPARKELIATVEARGVQVNRNLGESFVGVWNYSDNGDVALKATLKGLSTMLIAPRGAALNLKDQEMYVIDKVQNAFFAFALERILR